VNDKQPYLQRKMQNSQVDRLLAGRVPAAGAQPALAVTDPIYGALPGPNDHA
jgi:hypothetical protein